METDLFCTNWHCLRVLFFSVYLNFYLGWSVQEQNKKTETFLQSFFLGSRAVVRTLALDSLLFSLLVIFRSQSIPTL